MVSPELASPELANTQLAGSLRLLRHLPPARCAYSAISLRLGPASAPRRRRTSLRSMAPFPAHSWTAATRKPARLPRAPGPLLIIRPRSAGWQYQE